MKSKKNVYFLLPAVLLIWGLIGYKVYKALNSTDEVVIKTNELITYQPIEEKKQDTFSLQLNYRDPFLGKVYTSPKRKQPKRIIKVVKEVVFPKIIYNGMIAPKEKSRSPLYLININNTQYFFEKGQEIAGLTLVKANNSAVELSFKNKKRTYSLSE